MTVDANARAMLSGKAMGVGSSRYAAARATDESRTPSSEGEGGGGTPCRAAGGGGGTHFVPGSHTSNFPMHPDHMSLEPGQAQSVPERPTKARPAARSSSPRNLCHAEPEWRRDTPRVAMLNAYAHLATHWRGCPCPPKCRSGCRGRRRPTPRITDFHTKRATHNSTELLVGNDEKLVSVDHRPWRAGSHVSGSTVDTPHFKVVAESHVSTGSSQAGAACCLN